jgi:hypothetical protein
MSSREQEIERFSYILFVKQRGAKKEVNSYASSGHGQADLSRFNNPLPSVSKSNFDRQKPALQKCTKQTVTPILIFSCIAKDISD